MVHPLRLVAVIVVVVVVVVTIEVVVDMVVVEVVVMMGVEVVNIMEVEVVIMMVEVEAAIGVVLMAKKKVAMVRLHQRHHNLIMEGLVGIIQRHLTTHMLEMLIMERMLFLHLQAILVGLHLIHLLMVDPLQEVMVVRVRVM